MTAKIHFFPLGNADTLRIDLADGRKLLVDFADTRSRDDKYDLRCDLPAELRSDLSKAGRDYYDAVCITHVDNDHCKGFGEFFWLEHAKAYQDDDRIKITDLWVPAAAVLEENLKDDARLIRAEARHRLKAGKGVLIFSRPERLKQWMEENDIDYESRKHLMVDAGSLVPGYRKEGAEQAEFFVHCPFGWRLDETTVIDRNEASIVMQIAFREGVRDSYVLLGSDIDHNTISEIVEVTRQHGNEDRLIWDLMKLFHHCSYLALGPERGTDETKAVPDVEWLFETQGREGSVIVSPSWPIPVKGSKEDEGRSAPTPPGCQPSPPSCAGTQRAVHRYDGRAVPEQASTVRLHHHCIRRCPDHCGADDQHCRGNDHAAGRLMTVELWLATFDTPVCGAELRNPQAGALVGFVDRYAGAVATFVKAQRRGDKELVVLDFRTGAPQVPFYPIRHTEPGRRPLCWGKFNAVRCDATQRLSRYGASAGCPQEPPVGHMH